MKSSDLDIAWYVVRHFGQLMNSHERAAHSHLLATIKATHRDDLAAQEEAWNSKISLRFLSKDEEVLRLANGGFEDFVLNTAKRILAEHNEQGLLELLSPMPCTREDSNSPTMPALRTRLAPAPESIVSGGQY